MYTRQLANESRIYLILYVNDMLIVRSNQARIGKLKRSLHEKFVMMEPKSTSSYIFTPSGDAISWRSKLQECTTVSTIEAEYIATI